MKKIQKGSAFSLIELSIVIIIIGILIAGVTQGRNLIEKTRLSSARSLTKSSPVSSIKDLYLWYESTSINSFDSAVLDNDDPITTWYDISTDSSAKMNLTQSTTSLKPTYKTNSLNGLPTVYFNADELESTINYELTGNPDFTIFAVTKVGSLAYSAVLSSGIDAACQLVVFSRENVGNNGDLVVGYRASGETYTYKSLGTQQEFAMHTWVREAYEDNNDSHTGNTVFTNGVSQSLSDIGTVCTPDVEPAPLLFGNYGPAALNTPLEGNIAEIIIFSRDLKTKEREDIEKYLSQKWGINLG